MTDTATVQRAEGVSITIKTGKGYDDSWLGFTGTPAVVKATLIETFGLSDQEDLTLYEVVANATQVAHGVTRAVTGLKGTVIPNQGVRGPDGVRPDEAQQPSAPAAPAQAETDPYADLMKKIEADNINIDSLRRLYAENTELFTADTDEAKAAKKAWKAKGKALQTAT